MHLIKYSELDIMKYVGESTIIRTKDKTLFQ